MAQLQCGFAAVDWTPRPGLRLQGQMHERWATHTRDPLQANACALSDGQQEIILVTVDVCMINNELVEEIKATWSDRSGLPADSLMIHSTHTHVGPVVTKGVIWSEEPEAVEAMTGGILEAAQTARENLRPVQAFSGTGHSEQLGWNRRAMFESGDTRMYGHSEMPGFIGMEGPRDGSVPVIYFKDEVGKLVGVLTGFATHPNCMEGASFYSADFPGEVRRQLKALVGEDMGVLYFTAPAGDVAPSLLDPLVAEQPWRGDEGAKRSGQYFVGEVAKVLAMPRESMEPVLVKRTAQLRIPMRRWPEVGEPTRSLADNHYYQRAAEEWSHILATENPFPVRVSAIRIGSAVIATNPAELFVEFGLEIREGSPAETTLLTELTDGYCGYVPTLKAFGRGGYETWCAPSSRLEVSAGAKIVEATLEVVRGVFS